MRVHRKIGAREEAGGWLGASLGRVCLVGKRERATDAGRGVSRWKRSVGGTKN